MIRRQLAVALTGILVGNTVLFAQAAATTETQAQKTADRYMIIDLAGIPFTWKDESLTETQVSEAVSTEFEDFSESSLEAEEPPYYMSLTSLDNEYIAHLDQFDSLENSANSIDMYIGSQMAYAVSDIRTNESIISYLLDQYAGYDTYSAVEFYEVASLKPSDENGIYSLLLQQEEESDDVVHYSVADGTLQKTAVEAVLNEYGQPSYSLETITNHWMIVHLVSKVPSEGQDTVQTEEKETYEEASRSLEGAVEEDTANPTGGSGEDSQTSDSAAATVASTAASTATPTTSLAPTTAAPTSSTPTTAAPTTIAHTHTWTPVTKKVHHDATYKTVWVQDTAAWDETVVTKEAWDEPQLEWCGICNECGHVFRAGEDILVHMESGCWSSWHDEWVQVGTVHHDAETTVVHHDAVYNTVHHEAETTVVHHEATGHNEQVVDQAAWDEDVVTGYKCSGCGATK